MGLKEFYKFSWRKAAITLILFLIISLYLVMFGSLFITDASPPISTLVIVFVFFWPSIILSKMFGAIFYTSEISKGIADE